MKRILIFSLAYLPLVGGAEMAVKEITDRLGTRGLEFDMITLRFNRDLPAYEKVGNTNVHRIGFSKGHISYQDTFTFPLSLNKYLFPFIAFFKAVKLNKKRNYDAIWSIMANYAGFAALFFKLLYPKILFILTLQEGDPINYIKRRVLPAYPLFRMIFKKADRVQAISNYLADFAREMGYKGKVEVIPNGVDLRIFSREMTENGKKKLKKQLGIKEGFTILFTSSRLVKKNAVDDVIRALSLLPKSYVFLVAGDGPDEKKLKMLAKEKGVSERVSFLGHVSREELTLALSVSDVFVRPSLSEGLGSSFIEAMAAGVPVVATSVGGIPDFLFDPSSKMGKVTPTGLFAEVRDPESIAENVKRLIEDKELRRKIILNALKLAKEKYDWEKISSDMLKKVFNSALLDDRTKGASI